MKQSIFLLLLICGFAVASKADTIDYWQVFYNNKKLNEFNRYSKFEVKLKRNNINFNDSLTIKYFRDTPCNDCKGEIFVKDEKGKHVLSIQNIGIFNPLSFAFKDLIDESEKSPLKLFEVFYFDSYSKSEIKILIIFIED